MENFANWYKIRKKCIFLTHSNKKNISLIKCPFCLHLINGALLYQEGFMNLKPTDISILSWFRNTWCRDDLDCLLGFVICVFMHSQWLWILNCDMFNTFTNCRIRMSQKSNSILKIKFSKILFPFKVLTLKSIYDNSQCGHMRRKIEFDRAWSRLLVWRTWIQYTSIQYTCTCILMITEWPWKPTSTYFCIF